MLELLFVPRVRAVARSWLRGHRLVLDVSLFNLPFVALFPLGTAKYVVCGIVSAEVGYLFS